ncbi:hypothetical protein J4449_04430 [Candidatus Woesearchaeota archaeon]|nr:hypothetical protein [Candidatus Woesearchaeota archaeon]
MSIDAFVSIHPGRIRNSKEVNEILSRIKRFEKKRKCEAGVVIIQNRQLGGIYEIVSKEEAEKGIKNPRNIDRYVGFYQRSYFEELKERLEKESKSKQDN